MNLFYYAQIITGFLIVITLIVLFVLLNLNDRKKALDDGSSKASVSLDVSAEIIDRFYRSRFFGGAYYKLTIEIKAPLEKTFELEVDPELYQNKKIGENLLINVRYTKTIDKLKDIETITINDVSILE